MGIGGGTITKKLLFAALLIASLSLTGISGASASDVGTAETQTNKTNIVQEKFNKQINDTKCTNKSTTTQKSVEKRVKNVKKTYNKHKAYKHKKAAFKNLSQQKRSFEVKRTMSFQKTKDFHTTPNKNTLKQEEILKAKKDSLKRTHSVIQDTSDVNKWYDAVMKYTTKNKTKGTVKNAGKTLKTVTTQNKTVTNLINKNSVDAVSVQSAADTVKTNETKNLQAAAGEVKTKGATSGTAETAMAAGSPSTSKVPASLNKYLKSTKNCQASNSKIKSLAAKITKGKTTARAKAVAIFNWVRDNIGYSFYYNTKKGAVGTLNAKTGNCVDTAHLVVALARAAGLPAKYVHGSCKFSSGKTYGHVWAQIWVNGVWYNADATSSKNSFGVIKNWNTKTYKLKGTYASLSF